MKPTTGLILAGGAGRRMGCRDKGLVAWEGRPLIEHVVQRLRPQVGSLVISCNRNLEYYRRLCDRVVSDRRGGFAGPLAGLEAAMPVITTPYLLIAPCDCPLLPADLATRLLAVLLGRESDPVDVSYAHDGVRGQFLCAALRTSLLANLPAQMDAGLRAVRQWYGQYHCVAVDFSAQSGNFKNINSIDRLPVPGS